MEKRITAPIDKETAKSLKAGDSVLITGVIYTARDAAHERMTRLHKEGVDYPIDLNNQVIYYAGPCPAKPGEVIGSCGPTTAGRMDAYTPELLDNGLGAMIGIEFVKSKASKEPAPKLVSSIIQYAASRGLLMENAGTYNNVIRFLAPLVMTDAQLEAGLNIYEEAIAHCSK